MQPYGQDRVRSAGGRLLLHSPVSKGWTPRVPKSGSHSEHPGTAVLWDGEYYEVISAEPGATEGILYVLSPWREDHVMRQLAHYDESAELQRIADSKDRMLQQKQSISARLLSVLAGHLPAVVQHRIANRAGVSPSAMTLASCVLPLVIFTSYAFILVGALIQQRPSPLPTWFGLIAGYMLMESGLRFYIAMSQSRPVGSAAGFLAYVTWWVIALKASPDKSPFTPIKGYGNFKLAPSDEQELHDRLETWGPLLSLLSASEQLELKTRFGYEYRRHAFGLTWAILICSVAGFFSSALKLGTEGFGVSAAASLIAAGFVAIEQIRRLRTLRRGPAGSIFAVVIRPLVRRLFSAASSS